MSWSTIVVGTDGTERAQRAVRHAAALAAAGSAELVVVTAYPRQGATTARGGADPVPEDLQWATASSTAAEDAARAGADAAKAEGAGRVRVRTAPGDPTAVLLEVAADVGADLVVVGSKGMASPSRFVSGSIPNHLSHHTDRDLLIVHTD